MLNGLDALKAAIPDSYLSDMSIYEELFLNNFGDDDLIIMGLNSMESKNSENTYKNCR